ncbi:MAG: STAS domain-containing protein [Lachnospiraceae bacterium]|nr:STAS domain-containing protein [Lachnospiraceae bacterium]
MTITKELNGNEAVLRVDGRLDTQTSPELLSVIEGLDDTVTSLLLDFSGLEFISSAGLRVVIIASKKMEGALVIKNVSVRIMSIFEITGIDHNIKFE